MRRGAMRGAVRCAVLALAVLAGAAGGAARPAETYRVSKACAAAPKCFPTIQAAVDAAERGKSDDWAAIQVAAGDYREKVVVRRGRLRLTGAGAARTRLHFDAVAETAGRYDRGGWGTAGSATLILDGDEIVVRGLTIENDYDFLKNDALPSGDARKTGNSQGVAVQLDIHSDRVLFEAVTIAGYQDTLFTRGKRAIVRNSTISGNIDFIFGSGTLLIEDSRIVTRRRAAGVAPSDFASFVAAPSTPLSQPYGIVFYRSHLTREPGVADGSIALARPWHPTTVFPDGRYADPQAVGQVAFLDCTMDAHIHPDHWTSMAGTARDGTKTRIFRPDESRFYERGSRGAGVRRNEAVRTGGTPITIGEVRRTVLGGWTP